MSRHAISVFAVLAGASMASGTVASDAGLLGELSGRLASDKVLCAEFKQKRNLAALSRSLDSSGDMVFRKDIGVLWRVTIPFPSRALVTASEIVKWDGAGPPQRLSLDRSPLFRAITEVVLKLFAGDIAGLERSFSVAPARLPEARWHLKLTPKAAEVAKVVPAIEVGGGNFLEMLRVEEARGDSTEIVFDAARSEDCVLDETERRHFRL